MKQFLMLVLILTIPQFLLTFIFDWKLSCLYAIGFFVGMIYQTLCEYRNRLKLREDLLDLLKKISPRKKPALRIVKK